MTIAVDFDGTIVEHKYPRMGQEIPGAVQVLRSLVSDGHKLILWTVREGDLLAEALSFCSERGLTFYAVNSDTPAGWNGEGPRKIRADMFIDDCNLGGLPDWGAIYQMISSHKNWGDLLQSDTSEVHHSSGEHHGKGHSHHKSHRKGFLREIIDRCRQARANMEHTTYYGNSHHW